MESAPKTLVWQQFGAAIDMLGNALRACPEPMWRGRLWERASDPGGYAEFWYLAYHCLFWLDYYLTGAREDFAPPSPFTLSELDPGGFPERTYTRDELLGYLAHCRRKCRDTFETLTAERAEQPYRFSWGAMSFLELQLYNMRHVQEHAAQLSLFLGQRAGLDPGWVSRARADAA